MCNVVARLGPSMQADGIKGEGDKEMYVRVMMMVMVSIFGRAALQGHGEEATKILLSDEDGSTRACRLLSLTHRLQATPGRVRQPCGTPTHTVGVPLRNSPSSTTGR